MATRRRPAPPRPPLLGLRPDLPNPCKTGDAGASSRFDANLAPAFQTETADQQMSISKDTNASLPGSATFQGWGVFWLLVSIAGAAAFFQTGLISLIEGWGTPEYSY